MIAYSPRRAAVVVAVTHFVVFQVLFGIYRVAQHADWPLDRALYPIVHVLIWPAMPLVPQIYRTLGTTMYPSAAILVAAASIAWAVAAFGVFVAARRLAPMRAPAAPRRAWKTLLFAVSCLLLVWLFFGPLGEIPGDISFGILAIGHLPSGAEMIDVGRLVASILLCAASIFAAYRLIVGDRVRPHSHATA